MCASPASPRRDELLELAYRYVLGHGLRDLSLRPLAKAIGSSPRVLLYLFGSKEGLVRALLGRARQEELELLERLRPRDASGDDLHVVAKQLWRWLAAEQHRPLLTLWVEAYAQSLVDPEGPWAGFATSSVADWLALLASTQPRRERDTARGLARRTAVLAVLRGGLLDLLATGDEQRTTAAVELALGGTARRP